MKITRFDQIEFEVLDIVNSGFGHYPEGENADRALILMSEGVLVDTPTTQWQKVGWKFTDYGKEYYNQFISLVRKSHGHVWVTRNEAEEDNDPDGNVPYRFAYSVGYHNGYECKKCGFTFCVHCENEFDIPKCNENSD